MEDDLESFNVSRFRVGNNDVPSPQHVEFSYNNMNNAFST